MVRGWAVRASFGAALACGLSACLAPASPARASAFLEPPGAGQVISEFSDSSAGRFYDRTGRLRPATSYRKFELSSYVE